MVSGDDHGLLRAHIAETMGGSVQVTTRDPGYGETIGARYGVPVRALQVPLRVAVLPRLLVLLLTVVLVGVGLTACTTPTSNNQVSASVGAMGGRVRAAASTTAATTLERVSSD